MAQLTLRVPAELHVLLPRSRRVTEFSVPYDETSSLGHVVESAGVPLTEVGRLSVDGRDAPPAYRPESGAVVDVVPVERPQHAPERFLLDVHLGALARRLRLLGVDAAYRNDAADDELVAQAQAEDRVLLTQDRGLLRRRALPYGAYVAGARPDAQLADVLDRFAPTLAPWTRCPRCNGELRSVEKTDVEHLLPPGTRRQFDRFHRCSACGRIYWRGAHARRLEAIVDAAVHA